MVTGYEIEIKETDKKGISKKTGHMKEMDQTQEMDQIKKMKETVQIQELADIIKKLRSEDGCPWDREQTHKSLRPCIMEEAAELLAAIRIYEKTGDAENMQEELGDILLQVLLHSQIASEAGLFDLQDVIDGISEKMIRRHPHVFGDVTAETSTKVLQNWEEIKKKEKQGKSWIESPLREIPQELPALIRAAKVLKKAHNLYEAQGMNRMESGFVELAEKLQKSSIDGSLKDVEEDFGNIMLKLAEFSYKNKLSAEQILDDRIEMLIEELEPLAF